MWQIYQEGQWSSRSSLLGRGRAASARCPALGGGERSSRVDSLRQSGPVEKVRIFEVVPAPMTTQRMQQAAFINPSFCHDW